MAGGGGAGDRHVEDPPLLLAVVGQAVGEESVGRLVHDHVGPLPTLHGVDRREQHAASGSPALRGELLAQPGPERGRRRGGGRPAPPGRRGRRPAPSPSPTAASCRAGPSPRRGRCWSRTAVSSVCRGRARLGQAGQQAAGRRRRPPPCRRPGPRRRVDQAHQAVEVSAARPSTPRPAPTGPGRDAGPCPTRRRHAAGGAGRRGAASPAPPARRCAPASAASTAGRTGMPGWRQRHLHRRQRGVHPGEHRDVDRAGRRRPGPRRRRRRWRRRPRCPPRRPPDPRGSRPAVAASARPPARARRLADVARSWAGPGADDLGRPGAGCGAAAARRRPRPPGGQR